MTEKIKKFISQNRGVNAEAIICEMIPEAEAVRKIISLMVVRGQIEKEKSGITEDIYFTEA